MWKGLDVCVLVLGMGILGIHILPVGLWGFVGVTISSTSVMEPMWKMGNADEADIRTHSENTRVSSLRPRGTGGLSSDFSRAPQRGKTVGWNVLVAARMTAHSLYPRYGEVLFHELLVELSQATSGCFDEHVLQTIDWNHRGTLTQDRCCQ